MSERTEPAPADRPLTGRVAVVTGATRGGGRGIALALGDAGATVYVTGRSTRGAGSTEDLPGTVEDTADEVTKRGGEGVPVRCDFTVDADVDALFARVAADHGGLDVLVNNAWGGYEQYDAGAFDAPLWEQPLTRWDGMFTSGVRAHFLATRAAAPLLIKRGGGVIVSTTAWDHDKFLGNVFYDVAKAAVNRIVLGVSRELRPHKVAAVALAPGFMRTERVMREHEKEGFELHPTHSPEYAGRAVVALAADPRIMEKSGRVVTAGDVAEEYGFRDVDGRFVPPFRIPEDL